MLSGKRYSNNKKVRQWKYLYINSYKEGERTAGEIYGVGYECRS